ncbi:endospore germination permease [Solibacillus sp. CAU 1738]|uniref:endospore germination permease n=1 Tax=Solibacillus sp. CAU 1738 TaxID=3140363 RepID=UPI003260AA0C
MKNNGLISILHVILLCITFIGIKNHVSILPAILNAVGRDGWISVLLAGLFTFPWFFLLVYIHRKTNQEPIKDWLKKKIGKVGSAIVLFIIAIYLLVLAGFSMRETLLWVSTTFLTETPIIIPLIIYIILCITLMATNIQTIVMVNVMVLLVSVILGFFISFVNIQVKDYELLQPFLEHGFQPVLYGMIFPASGFVELLLLLFLQHKFKDRINWKHYSILLFIFIGLTIGPLIGAIVEFGPEEAAKQRYPAYEEWGLATIGSFVENISFFSVYQWLTGTFIRVVVILYIVADILNIAENKKKIWTMLAPPFFFITLSLFLIKDKVFLEINEKGFLKITFVFFIIISFFLAIVAIMKGKKTIDQNLIEQNLQKGDERGEDQWNPRTKQ